MHLGEIVEKKSGRQDTGVDSRTCSVEVYKKQGAQGGLRS